MIERIQAGNTVRLTCIFYDAFGVVANPSAVKIIFYDSQYQKMNEIPLDDNNRLSVGTYFFDFQTDAEEKRYIYEWQGMFDGFPSVKRSTFKTEFM